MKQGTSTSSCKSFSLQFVTFRNNCWKKWWYVESVPYEKYRIELSRPLGFSYQHDTTSVFLQVWSVIIHHVNLPRLLSMVKVLLRWKGFRVVCLWFFSSYVWYKYRSFYQSNSILQRRHNKLNFIQFNVVRWINFSRSSIQ